jgi:hypothetical protein
VPPFKHGSFGGKHRRAYASWSNLRQRCQNSKDPSYKNYGGRGIECCSRWDEFLNFLEDMGDPPLGTMLERKDNNGPYCSENCKWDSRTAQNRNQRRTLTLEKVEKIRRLYWQWGMTQVAIGKYFGVSQYAISAILLGKTWTT